MVDNWDIIKCDDKPRFTTESQIPLTQCEFKNKIQKKIY